MPSFIMGGFPAYRLLFAKYYKAWWEVLLKRLLAVITWRGSLA
jgi:hypothetical protein